MASSSSNSKKQTPNQQQPSEQLDDIYPFNPQETVVTGLDVFEVSFAKYPKNGSERFSIIQEKDFLELKRERGEGIVVGSVAEMNGGVGGVEIKKVEEKKTISPSRSPLGVIQDAIKSLQKLTTLQLIPSPLATTTTSETKVQQSQSQSQSEGDNNMPAGTESTTPVTPVTPTVTVTPSAPNSIVTPVVQEAQSSTTTTESSNNNNSKFMTQEQFNILQETNQRIQQENQALRTMVRRGKIEQEVKKSMRHLPIKQEKMVELLLQMDSEKDGLHKDIAELLVQCDRIISKGKVFDEAGRRARREDGQGLSAYEKIESEARKLMKSEPKLRLEQAIDRVAQDNPKLHARYVAEMESEQRRVPVLEAEDDDMGGEESEGGGESGGGGSSGDDDD